MDSEKDSEKELQPWERCVINITLRKSKTKEEMVQRRTAFFKEMKRQTTGKSLLDTKMDEMLEAISSKITKNRIEGVRGIRELLSEDSASIDLVIKRGIVPIMIHFLNHGSDPELQLEATSVLSEIAFGNIWQTGCIIEHGAIPKLIALLQSRKPKIAAQPSDVTIPPDTATPRLPLLRQLVKLLMSLCRSKNPPPRTVEMNRLLPVLRQLLSNSDVEVVSDTCWAIFHLSDDSSFKIQAVIEANAVGLLVNLLEKQEDSILIPALRCVGNIAASTDDHTDVVLLNDVLPKLVRLLQHPNSNIVREAAWTVSNIAAGNNIQLEALLQARIYPEIKKVLETGHFRAQREAIWAVANAIVSGTSQQTVTLVKDNNLLPPFLNHLNATDASPNNVILVGLEHLLSAADEHGMLHTFCQTIEEMDGLQKLEDLQYNDNADVSAKATKILDKYFNHHDIEEPQ
ncbi:importin subunit alpha-like [Drosophila tropicalis]|uniref:importin subunit alpha-like n=1 Tax=Drosophila tropicalis TaxID=46794 RepID=UPI0035AC07FF